MHQKTSNNVKQVAYVATHLQIELATNVLLHKSPFYDYMFTLCHNLNAVFILTGPGDPEVANEARTRYKCACGCISFCFFLLYLFFYFLLSILFHNFLAHNLDSIRYVHNGSGYVFGSTVVFVQFHFVFLFFRFCFVLFFFFCFCFCFVFFFFFCFCFCFVLC
jgi:hypothetical protein